MEGSKKEHNINMFKAASFFMIRCPLLPVKVYNEIFNNFLSIEEVEKKIFKLANESIVREAIAVSSLSLYESLTMGKFYKDEKKRKQVLSSLLKYIIRITTRTTPYGLFSGVTLGEFAEKTEIKLNNKNKHMKRTRPDMEWLYAIIRKIEDDDEILNELHVKANDLAVANGSRLDIGYISNYGQTVKDTSIDTLTASVRYSSQVQIIMSMTKESIQYGKLLLEIQLNNPNVPQARIKKFLSQLLKNEYIVTEMRPPLINTSPFEYIISKLKKIKTAEEIYLNLSKIKDMIAEYDSYPIGEGETLYKEIINSMKQLKECKNYMQVDLRLKEDKAMLNLKVAQEIEKTAEALLRVTNGMSQPYHFKKYMDDFREKYGIDREVPVIELLDNDRGLGSPAGYSKPESNRYIEAVPQYEHDKKFQKYLINKVLQTILKNEKEVILTEEDINYLEFKKLSEYTNEELPKSLEFNVLIEAESPEAIDNDNYRIFIGPNYGSDRAGKTFGRFIDILPEQIKNKQREFQIYEKGFTKGEVVYAELVELPQSGRVSNVSINSNEQEYELALSTNFSGKKERLNISDLYIGISKGTRQKFYIKSKALNKKVILTSNHMLNVMSGSNIYRFLREVSQYETLDIMEKLYNNELKNFNYVPRIRYGKVILCPSTWKLSKYMLDIDLKSDDKRNFYCAIKKWRDEWRVPRFVYIKEADNRLLLNLDNPLHLDELLHLFQGNSEREVVLNELEGDFGNVWVNGQDGAYFSEMVVPVFLNSKFINELEKNKDEAKPLMALNTKSDYKRNAIKINSFDKVRYFFPGDEWLYLKLYGNSKRVDEFIAYEMLPFCEELVKNRDVEKFFFIRYADPDIHIRLRLKGNKSNLYTVVMPKLGEWFDHLRGCGLLTRVSFDTYFRENERYGGNELIHLAEEIFCSDSIFVSNILNLKRNGQIDLDIKYIAVASIINLMEELKIDYDTQKKLFMYFYDKNGYRELFQEDRGVFLKIGNSSNGWTSLREVEGGQSLISLFEVRKQSLNIFADKMNYLDKVNKLCNSKLDIILSLIHMFCNRLVGTSEFEQTVMSLVRHTLQSVEYIKKHSTEY